MKKIFVAIFSMYALVHPAYASCSLNINTPENAVSQEPVRKWDPSVAMTCGTTQLRTDWNGNGITLGISDTTTVLIDSDAKLIVTAGISNRMPFDGNEPTTHLDLHAEYRLDLGATQATFGVDAWHHDADRRTIGQMRAAISHTELWGSVTAEAVLTNDLQAPTRAPMNGRIGVRYTKPLW